MKAYSLPTNDEVEARARPVHFMLENLDAVRSYTRSNGVYVSEILSEPPGQGKDGRERLRDLINDALKSEFSLHDVYAYITDENELRVQLFRLPPD